MSPDTKPDLDRAPLAIGISLKMYMTPNQTQGWITDILAVAKRHQTLLAGQADLFVMPAFTELREAVQAAHGNNVAVGAQDLFWDDNGAYTGEISGAALAEIGCQFVEVGHAERRRILREDDQMVAAKVAAALRNGLEPVLCVGEDQAVDPDLAAALCRVQLVAALDASDALPGPITVAYEPVWAIGAAEPAAPEHIRAVCAALRDELSRHERRRGSRIIYGGSAGPGLLSKLAPEVDGLFLGRFAHDPAALDSVLDEVTTLSKEVAA